MILVCMDCNRTRGNSLDDRRFVNFVLHDPDLYRRHVKMASCDDGTKTELLEVLPNTLSSDCQHSELNYSNRSIADHCREIDTFEDKSEMLTLALDEHEDRIRELLRQYTARELAASSRPIPGGRAAKARWKAERRSFRRRRRHMLKDEVRLMTKAQLYLRDNL